MGRPMELASVVAAAVLLGVPAGAQVAAGPNVSGLRIYVVTDASRRTLTPAGEPTADLEHPGALLELTYRP